jgi:alkylation response protein AidB-like acyl-CoA dehydrogenase
MLSPLTAHQRAAWSRFREVADEVIAPRAAAIDVGGTLPPEVIKTIAGAGWICSLLPVANRGAADMLTYGVMSEEIGRTCSSVRNFVAVQDMVAQAIWSGGDADQQRHWIPAVAGGERIAAFALTEPGVGSDAKSVQTTAAPEGDHVILNGHKKWISFGATADVLLVFADFDGRHTGFLVEADRPGVHVEPTPQLLGLRGSALAEIRLDRCRIPMSNMVGRPGTGLAFIASSALDIGRYSTACGCVGLAQACLEKTRSHADERIQFGTAIIDHQLVQRMFADMICDIRAARLLCWDAGNARDDGDPEAVERILAAKYFASTMVNRVAADAVQVHGAEGMAVSSVVGRFFRDAKAMEIIEGTTQVLQSLIGRWASIRHPLDLAEASGTAQEMPPAKAGSL